jgi:GT2 family glycosyltransferase
MELSVIIVSYNVKDFLQQCLLSVKRATQKISAEIYVVDNNSSDQSAEMIEKDFPEVILIKNSSNAGFAAANNQAIKLAAGQFVLLLNPDTLIEADTLDICLSFMNEHKDAGAIGVRMIDGDGRFLPESKRAFPGALTAFFKISGLTCLFPRSRIFSRYYLSHINNMSISVVEVIAGAFMFIRSQALLSAGLLDEDFFMYGEDIDLSYRITKAGYNNYYLPDAKIIHFKGKSTSKDNYSDVHHFYEAMRTYVRKRAHEGDYACCRSLIITATHFSESMALIKRFFRIKLKYIFSR